MVRILTLIIIAALIITGCEKNSSSEEITKISSDEHNLIKEYSDFKTDNALNQAKIYFRAGDLQKTIEILKKFLTYYPNHSIAHFYLGKAYYEINETPKGLYHIKKAFLLDELLAKDLAGPVIGNEPLGRVFVTDDVIKEKNLALKPKAWFDKDTQLIYASLEIINAPANTEIETEWVYELSKKDQIGVNTYKFTTEGSKNALISLKKPSSGWPAGKYQLNIYVNRKKNTGLDFYVF